MPVLFAVMAATWATIGAVLSILMGRRGHDAYAWLLLGMFLGPIALILAAYVEGSPHRQEPDILALPARGSGPVDVLVGFDGSAESRAAADCAVDLLGERIGRLTIARVVPFYGGSESQQLAQDTLAEEGARLRPREVGLEIVEGNPPAALSDLAAAAGYEVIAIGTRGAGLSSELLGSTAVALARHSKLPVLLVGGTKMGRDDEGS
jgi:nucleotide-binding universal stress UspA family protein